MSSLRTETAAEKLSQMRGDLIILVCGCALLLWVPTFVMAAHWSLAADGSVPYRGGAWRIALVMVATCAVLLVATLRADAEEVERIQSTTFVALGSWFLMMLVIAAHHRLGRGGVVRQFAMTYWWLLPVLVLVLALATRIHPKAGDVLMVVVGVVTLVAFVLSIVIAYRRSGGLLGPPPTTVRQLR